MLTLAPVSAQTLILMLDLTKMSDEDRSTIFSIAAKAQQQEAPAEPEAATTDDRGLSFPITEGQGRALLGAIDARTKALLRRFAEEYDPETGKAQLEWPVTKEILFGADAATSHGVKWWEKFTKGHLSGLHRSLRHITKDPKAVLLVRADTDEAAHYIDAPAILILRNLFGIN